MECAMELNIPKSYAYMGTQFEILCNLLQDASRREEKIKRSNIEHSCNDLSTLPLYSIWLTNIINNSYRENLVQHLTIIG